MSIEIQLEGSVESEKDFEAITNQIHELSEKWHLKMEVFERFALIDVCPEGFIEVSYDEPYLSVCAQTNVAGPGFHAFVCSFFDDVIKLCPITLSVSDPTGYFDERDFEKLRTQIFYRWLSDIGNYIQDIGEKDHDLCISWPLDYYHPKAKDGFVITPMGYMAKEDFQTLSIEELAQRFFIWNNYGRDAQYYRNAALNLLWKECFYEYTNMNEYTEKMAGTILDYIEIAHEMDKELPLPLHEYQELCEVSGREMKITDATALYIPHIGYRKEIVEFHFGNWSIPAHGCCEKSVDESSQTLYLMAPYHSAEEPWLWMYRVNIFAFKQPVTTFLAEIEHHEKAFDEFTFGDEEMQGKGNLERKEDHIILQVQINCGCEMMVLQVVICKEEDIEEIKTQVQNIKCRKINDDQMKN